MYNSAAGNAVVKNLDIIHSFAFVWAFESIGSILVATPVSEIRPSLLSKLNFHDVAFDL